MSNNPKVQLSRQDVARILDSAHKVFMDTATFSNLDVKEMQVYLILKGLEDVLKSKGIEPPFEFTINTKR